MTNPINRRNFLKRFMQTTGAAVIAPMMPHAVKAEEIEDIKPIVHENAIQEKGWITAASGTETNFSHYRGMGPSAFCLSVSCSTAGEEINYPVYFKLADDK